MDKSPHPKKMSVLLVDDTPANILALEKLLEKEDRILLTASGGDEALKIALNQEVDLIILDVQMPGIDGFEVAQILKSNKRTREIPIIFASAEKREYKFMIKGLEEGAIDYLYKPLDADITRAKVNVLLQLQSQKKELIEKNLSLERAALLINNSADIIGIIDARTLRFEEINNAFTTILGYPSRNVQGLSLDMFLSDDQKETIRQYQSQQSERLFFETHIVCHDNTFRWLQWNVVVKDKKWFFNARDITQQKVMDNQIMELNANLKSNLSQLEATNKELESFSYSVSHDLRAPLRSLSGYSQMLEDDYSEKLDERAKKCIQVIQKNTVRMGHLIDDLLKFSKLGREEVKKVEINMNDLVQNIVEDVRNSQPNQAEIMVHPLPQALADYSLIHQVWFNLISNAVKYSSKKDNPQIEIGSLPSAGEHTFYVKDNGAGFDMAYADKLFGVFQRLHRQQEFEGTGIGLAIIYRIITKHGGRVWAEGKVNEGATFYFALPI